MRIAKSRKWTEEEVEEAVAAIKREPGLWEELENIEKTTGEFRGTKSKRNEMSVVIKLHPECELNEVTDLRLAIRQRRRAQLGLE